MIKNIELTKVEENSEKDQMTNQEDLVTFLRRIPCQLLKSGLRPVEARYFFCSCDVDMKEPICEDCKERCHEGHAVLRVEEGLSAVCACGMKCHSIRDDSTEVNSIYNKKCFFHEFSQVSGINIYYESKDKPKVLCMFCYNFCFEQAGQFGTNYNSNNTIVDHRQYNSISSINKNSEFYDKKIYARDMALFPECNCTHPNHKELKYLYGKLKYIASEIFTTLDFENFTYTHITNLLMVSHRSYDNIFHSFVEGMAALNSNIKDLSYQFEDLYSPTNEFNLCLETISKISAKTKRINYFSNKISSCLPSIKTLCHIMERKFDHKMLTIWNMKFYLMSIYLKFGFKRKFKSLPNFKIYDIENMSPLQRLSFVKEVQEKSYFNFSKKEKERDKEIYAAASMNIHNFVKEYNSNNSINQGDNPNLKQNLQINSIPNKNTQNNCNIISSITNNNQRKNYLDPHVLDLFLSTLNKLNNIKDKLPETYLVIYRCFQVIKLFAKFSLFSYDQLLKFSSLNDEVLVGFSESLKTVNSNDKKTKIKLIDFQFQILSPMVKSIRYLIFHKNDQFVENFLKESEMKIEQVIFYHGKSLISKSLSKNAINIMTYLRYFKQKEYDSSKDSQMHKLLSQAFKIISMNVSDPDYYSTGLIRLFDKNKQIYFKYLSKKFDRKEKDFIKFTSGLSTDIEKKYKKYFLFQISYKELSGFVINSIKSLLENIGVKNYSPNFLNDIDDIDLDRLDKKEEMVTVGKKDGKVTLIKRRKTNPNLRDMSGIYSERPDRSKNENLKNQKSDINEKTHAISQIPASENVILNETYVSKLSQKEKENSPSSYIHKFRILLNKSNIIFSVIKIIKILQLEHLSKYKSLETFKLDAPLNDEIFKLLGFFLEENLENCIIFLSSDFTEIFININHTDDDSPSNQIYKFVELLEYAILSLLKANYDFSSNFTIIKIIKEISSKCSINSSKYRSQRYVENTILILSKLFNIIKCCTRLQFVNYEHTEEKLRRIVKNIYKDNTFFKEYLTFLIESKIKIERRESLDNSFKIKSQLSKVSTVKNLDVNYHQPKRENFDNYVIHENNLSQNEGSSSRLESNNVKIIEAPPTSKINTNRELTINTNIECELNYIIDFNSNPLISKNLTKLFEILNHLFDGEPVLNEKDFLENLIKPEDIPKILKSKSLDLKFRIEILKFFRMVYVDLVISYDKADLYRNLIINPPRSSNEDENLDIMTSGDNENLKLYEELININLSPTSGFHRGTSNININPNLHQNKITSILNLDSAVLKYELKHFYEILSLNKNLDQIKCVEYIEQGLLNPLIVHINKLMSLIYILPVEEYLKLYELVFYFLKLKEYVLLNFSYLFLDDEFNHVVKKLFKNDFGKNLSRFNQPLIRRDIGSDDKAMSELRLVRKDIEEMEESNFEILNYGLVFSVFEKHLKNFVYKPRLQKSMKKIFTKKEFFYSEEKIEKMRNDLDTSGMLKSEFEQKVFELIIKYRNDKMKLYESYFLNILDEENTHHHLKYRNLLIRSLFFLISDIKASLRYSRISFWAIFKLLQYDTTNVQKCVYELSEQKSKFFDIHELVNLFFSNFLSILFSVVRPSQCTISSTYFTSITIIKVLKYLCEEHNPKFQKIFFQEVKFRFLADEYLSNYAGYKQKRLALLQNMNSMLSPLNSSVNVSKSFNHSKSLINSSGSPTNSLAKKNALLKKRSLNQKFKNSNSLAPNSMAVIKEKDDYGTNEKENVPKVTRLISPIKKSEIKSDSIDEENDIEVNQMESPNKFKQSASNGKINYKMNKLNLQMNRLSSQSKVEYNENNSLEYQEITMFDFMLSVLGKIIFLSKWEKCEMDCNEKDLAFFSDIFSVIVELLIEMIQGTEKSNLQSILGDSLTESEEEAAHFINFLNSVKPVLLNDNNNSIVLLKIRKDVVDFMMAFLEEKSTPIKLVTIMSNVIHPNTIIETIINVMKKLYLKKGKNSKFSNLSLKDIQFDGKMSNFFSQVYFQDQEFCQTEEFELANRMYQYVKLLATNEKYAHEDAINIIELVSKYEESVIVKSYEKKIYSSKNKNTKDLSENSDKEKGKEMESSNPLISNAAQTFDDYFYETYFCVKFFEKITRTVLVQLDENTSGEENLPVRVIFTLNPLTMYLSHITRLAFYEKVNRDGRYIKLYSLMEQSDEFYDEIKYNSESSNKFSRFLNSLNYYYLDLFSFCITVTINILMLVFLSQKEVLKGHDKYTPIINAFAYLTISFNALVIICWFYSKYSLYFLIEKKKYLSKTDSSDIYPELEESISLTFSDKILVAFNTVVLRNEINSFLWNLILASIAVSNPNYNFVYSVQLFVIVNLSETLKNIIRSVTMKYKQFLTTTMLMILVCYVYACIAFFYFSEDFIFNIFDPLVSNY